MYGVKEICERAQKAHLRCPAQAELDFSDTITDHAAACQGCGCSGSSLHVGEIDDRETIDPSEVIWELLLYGRN
jgi:hypothetical protein